MSFADEDDHFYSGTSMLGVKLRNFIAKVQSYVKVEFYSCGAILSFGISPFTKGLFFALKELSLGLETNFGISLILGVYLVLGSALA
ncbi:hypothetical protein ACH5RR_006694 [Cinchona calisaya]|uniref:Uncharacterized protein n=1 Tax=Cinchona calisaya TaxID=153742 RepID=A0ABD3APS3_9GENT